MSQDNQNFPSPPPLPPPVYQNYPQYATPPKNDNTIPIVIGVVCGCGCLLILVIGVLIALLLPAVQAAREAARRMQCSGNEKQIMIALHNYHDTYGTFPPAYSVDQSGKALHSWRVLILPFMEQGNLYDQIKLDESWDSSHNSQFHAISLPCYICPSASRSKRQIRGLTSYKMVVGPNTISDGPSGRKISELVNGTSNIIGIVEVIPTTNWMEPTEIPFDELDKGINWSKTEGIGSRHSGGINIALMDGSVRFVSDTVDMNTIKQAVQAFPDNHRTSSFRFHENGRLGEGSRANFESRRKEAEQRLKEMQNRTEQRLKESSSDNFLYRSDL